MPVKPPIPPEVFRPAAEAALTLVPAGSVVGLGTGRAATAFVYALGDRVRAGLVVRGVPTSDAAAALAVKLGILLTTLDEVDAIDVAIDGADEVDPNGNVIKGYGGALVREKIVASAARQFVIMVGAEKLVPALGTRGIIPVEVVPFAVPTCRRRLSALGIETEVRENDGLPFRSDNGNPILDCRVGPLDDPASWVQKVRAIPGVVDTGLFLGMADAVIVQTGTTAEIRRFEKKG